MPGPNLVLNSGFETGDFTDWRVTDPEPQNPDIGVDNQPLDVHSGSYGVFAGNEASTLGQYIPTIVGHTYTVSFWLDVYQSTAYNGGVTASFGGQSFENLVEPTETDAFTHYTAQVTATSTSSLLQFTFSDPGGYFGFDDVSVTDNAACYVRGARILTSRGEIEIERLAISDLVVTASGALRPVRWLGRRSLDIARHRDPAAVQPVRVARDAFGEGLPHRDLWLSPGHNIAWDGVLIPISALINGVSIRQEHVSHVEYWHVELDAHDVISAEGLPAESYLDTGNRAAFANGGAFVEAHPDFEPKHFADTCLPLKREGVKVARVKARLLARLEQQGDGLVRDAEAYVDADGLRIEPMRLSSTRLAFALPDGAQRLLLKSRTFIPAHAFAKSSDLREMGLCVARLQVDGETIALEQDEGRAGWREAEFARGRFVHRWTGGVTPLPDGARIVIVDLAGEGYYRREARRAPCSRDLQIAVEP